MSLKKLIDTDTLARFLLKIKALIPSLPLEASSRILIPDDSDLNDIVTAGTYRTSGNYSQSITNAPTSALVYEPFYLYVVQGSGPYNDNGCYQIVFPSDLNVNSDVYIRRYSPYLETSVQGYDGPVWSDWMNVRDPQTVNGHTVQSDVPANAVFTDTTYTPASVTPLMDGTAAVGTSDAYAREDHVHPSDSSRFALDFSGTEITADSNLNSYRTPGNYYCLSANASTITNSPVSSDQFKLVVVKAAPASTMNGTVYQFVFGGNTLNYTVYFRCRKMDLTWTSWADIRDARTVNGHTVLSDVPSNAVFTDTTYESKTAASGGTDVSLVTTGEKYAWNNKSNTRGTVRSVYMDNTLIGTSGAEAVTLPPMLVLNNDLSTSIPANSDLNLYTSAGNYYCAHNASTLSHRPPNASLHLRLIVFNDRVTGTGGSTYQIAFGANTGDTTDTKVYMRCRQPNSGWTNWFSIIQNDLYYTVTTSAVTSGEIMRVPSGGTSTNITADTVVASCVFADPSKITSDVTWTSYAGYVAFTGTCTAATTAYVTLIKKSN